MSGKRVGEDTYYWSKEKKKRKKEFKKFVHIQLLEKKKGES